MSTASYRIDSAREHCVQIFREKNVRHPEGGTEDGIEDSNEEGLQDGDGIAPSSKSFLLLSQKEEKKLKAIQRTEKFLIDSYGGRKEQDLLN